MSPRQRSPRILDVTACDEDLSGRATAATGWAEKSPPPSRPVAADEVLAPRFLPDP